ncbi:GH13424 [Drosophila grimshawi]|uniref:Protein ref(2)P n=1 Tax=Drosophila grimshawi TaxID=7222 RepID=B4JPD6_DROGR|nr:GH13424 [Drosophila grimshawi]
MSEKFLKITYNIVDAGAAGATRKLNTYILLPEFQIDVQEAIKSFLFEDSKLPEFKFRTYWIDNDGDEIEIANMSDYIIFKEKCADNMRIQVASEICSSSDSAEPKIAQATPENVDDPTNFIIHDGVECDSCNLAPIIGFRYKCVQCPNFDLCQSCERAHKHPNHMMVRMPNNNGPSVIDAWMCGPGSHHRRSHRRFRGQCPFSDLTVDADAETPTGSSPGAAPAANGPKESRRDRRHARRHGAGSGSGGVFSQFMEMMMNLPESNTTPTTSAAAPATATAPPKEQPVEQTTAETKSQNAKEEAFVVQDETVTEEPVAAPRSPKEEPKLQATSAPAPAAAAPTQAAGSSTPTTPVISLENLAQMVNPEYVRAGIEILNNFSEMFAKMIDPSEAAAFGCAETSMASSTSSGSTASQKTEAGAETTAAAAETSSAPVTVAASVSVAAPVAVPAPVPVPVAIPTLVAVPTPITVPTPVAVTDPTPAIPTPTSNDDAEKQRSRSESLGQDWQMIDNTATLTDNVSSADVLINLNNNDNSTITTTAPAAVATDIVSPTHDYVQLGEMLRQHVNEEEQQLLHQQQQQQQREQSTAHTQTSQVNTVSTSTSTMDGVAPTAANPPPTAVAEEWRSVLVYHHDERINAAVHAMMAMGFSNEGAWLTQLLESVEGNIPAALDIMHTSQSGRN